jgi:hypothetical protein
MLQEVIIVLSSILTLLHRIEFEIMQLDFKLKITFFQ